MNPHLKRKHELLAGLILLAGVFFVAVAAPSRASNSSQARPQPEFTPYQTDEFNEILQISAVGTGFYTGYAGCVRENYGTGGGLTCNAGDTTIANAEVLMPLIDSCAALGTDTVTFTAEIEIDPTQSGQRYDLGVFFAVDGDPNNDGALSAPGWTNPPGGCFISSVPRTPQLVGGGFTDLDGNQCGDTTTSNNDKVSVTVTALCIDKNGDGRLDLPYCVTNRNQPATCTGITSLAPNPGSKCTCNNNFSVSVPVPAIDLDLTKTANPTNLAPGQNVTYTIVYKNVDQAYNNDNAINLVVTDNLDPNLQYISATPGGAGSCVHDGSPNGGLVTCSGLPNLVPDATGTITLVAKVLNNANTSAHPFTIPNTAVVTGQGQTNNNTATAQDTVSITTPVTMSAFTATVTAAGTRFDWSTASETINAGFNLYVETADGRRRINDAIIPATGIDSLTPQVYAYDAPGVSGEKFYLEDVGLFGENRFHGPFVAGETYGEPDERERIDWAAIANEQESLAQAAASMTAADTGMSTRPGVVSANALKAVDLYVRQGGVHRLTYEQIKAATGVDFNGVSRSALALTNRGQPVPFHLSKNTFGPGVFIEFIGEGLETLYTDTNVYRLAVNQGLNRRVSVNATLPSPAALLPTALPTFYMEERIVADDKQYSYLSASDDPWFDTFLYAAGPATWDYTLNIDNYVPEGDAPKLKVSAWGASGVLNGPDHHIKVVLNGQQVADKLFDDNDVVNWTIPVSNALLKQGANTLTLIQPMDLGAQYDVAGLESYGVVYPRAFVAQNGRLTFQGKSAAFVVTNLPSKDVVVYRQDASGTVARLTGLVIEPNGGGTFKVGFRGTNYKATYYVTTVAALSKPEMSRARATGNLTSPAEYLVISHPSFINGLTPLVNARKTTYTVKVVDVRDIYTVYNGGIVDAAAIASYIRQAISTMGVKYVLLVGGDTNDYHDNLGLGSLSFIPSLYARTFPYVNFAPVDPLYTDTNGDMVPDVPIGRFPVKTLAELDYMVQKTLQYDARANVKTAVFAADAGFDADSNSFAANLGGWNIGKTYLSAFAANRPAARTELIAALNKGPRLTSFVGHSGLNHWSYSPMLRASDAAALTNVNQPTLVTQWGCWNTYFVEPQYEVMANKFLVSGMNGAAAVTGATTLTYGRSEQALGQLMMRRLMMPGITLGDAMQSSKSALAVSHPEMIDVLLGWTVLGDPAVVLVR